MNGINDDNRIENLTFLCPNCHSQTDTYSGKKNKKKKIKKKCKCGKNILKTSNLCVACNSIKNRKVKKRPALEDLLNAVNENGYKGAGKKYNVSDNTIRNWIKDYKIK